LTYVIAIKRLPFLVLSLSQFEQANRLKLFGCTEAQCRFKLLISLVLKSQNKAQSIKIGVFLF
jgi:hypothetical protein